MRRSSWLRILLAVVTIVFVIGAPSATGAQTTPPPRLTGETLHSWATLSGNCDEFSFVSRDVINVYGPYAPGTFFESGEGSAPNGVVTTLTTQFEIDSDVGIVTGTKTYTPGDGTSIVSSCEPNPFNDGIVLRITANFLPYTATIVTPDGLTCTTTGIANLTVSASVNANYSSGIIQEQFGASTEPDCSGGGEEPGGGEDPGNGEPGDPVVKDDCKNGGWEAYGFTNQGRCIQFVNTGVDSRP